MSKYYCRLCKCNCSVNYTPQDTLKPEKCSIYPNTKKADWNYYTNGDK